MSAQPSIEPTHEIILVRAGEAVEMVAVPMGTTLAGFLNLINANEYDVRLNGEKTDPAAVVPANAIVHLMPRGNPSPLDTRWTRTFGRFADDPIFDRIVEAGRSIRQAERDEV
jgi:hypothetical protein